MQTETNAPAPNEIKLASNFKMQARRLLGERTTAISRIINDELIAAGKSVSEAYHESRYGNQNHKLSGILSQDEIELYFPSLVSLAASRKQEIDVKCKYMRSTAEQPSWKGTYYYVSIRVGDCNIRFEFQNWTGCCAMGIVSQIVVYGGTLLDMEFRAGLAEGIVPFMRSQLGVHQVIFSYSDEEIKYQDEIWKEWGGYDLQDPYLSFKTGNHIHTAALTLADAHDWSQAAEHHQDHLDQDEEYGGYDDEEPDFGDDED